MKRIYHKPEIKTVYIQPLHFICESCPDCDLDGSEMDINDTFSDDDYNEINDENGVI